MKIVRKSQRAGGFTFIELIVAITIIGLLAGIAIPYSMRARDNARLASIQSNLRVLENAKAQWALDNHKTTGDPVDLAVLRDYFRASTGIQDVMHETYVPNAVGVPAEADLPSGATLGKYPPGAVIAAD
jgi:prepilin-type N-terminal cleavage/methylation domain-containing protein